jgi:hypothetical protein
LSRLRLLSSIPQLRETAKRYVLCYNLISMFKDRKFIHIDNCLELGKFYSHFGEKQFSSIMLPVFNIVVIEDHKKYELHAGYIDRKGIFFSCPLEIHFLKISKYLIDIEWIKEKSNQKTTINLFLEIYSADFSNSLELEIVKSEYGYTSLSFMNFNDVINYLNLYVSFGKKLGNLDINALNDFYPQNNPISNITSAVNNLDLKVFENSKNRVGKDNRFWTDLEIRNLPKNKYLTKLIKDSFKLQGLSCNSDDNGLVVELSSDYMWSPTIPRKQIIDYDLISIRDQLKISMAKEFDEKEYIVTCLENQHST